MTSSMSVAPWRRRRAAPPTKLSKLPAAATGGACLPLRRRLAGLPFSALADEQATPAGQLSPALSWCLATAWSTSSALLNDVLMNSATQSSPRHQHTSTRGSVYYTVRYDSASPLLDSRQRIAQSLSHGDGAACLFVVESQPRGCLLYVHAHVVSLSRIFLLSFRPRASRYGSNLSRNLGEIYRNIE